MKRFLPKSSNSGFTLVELLIVVSIIAVLSVVGMVVYGNLATGARDAARKADVQAISKALEVNKTGAGYQVLAGSQFASGSMPVTDPSDKLYCLTTTTAAVNGADPATWTTACPTDYSPVSATNPAANSSEFKVCADLESGSRFCIKNTQ